LLRFKHACTADIMVIIAEKTCTGDSPIIYCMLTWSELVALYGVSERQRMYDDQVGSGNW
jgi:hypothetical protein